MSFTYGTYLYSKIPSVFIEVFGGAVCKTIDAHELYEDMPTLGGGSGVMTASTTGNAMISVTATYYSTVSMPEYLMWLL